MKYQACLRSGYCCKKAPCGFGEWNKDKTQCKFLGGDDVGEHFCTKHEEITKKPGWEISPAFGFGCCSPLNSDRRSLVAKRGGVEVYVDVAE